MSRAAPPRVDHRETAAAVRRVFDDAGYEAGRIQERLGTTDRALAQTPDRPVYLRRIGEADALAVLLRLFMLDAHVTRALAERQLGKDGLSQLERVGLIATDEEGLVDGTARIVPHEHLLIASDRYTEGFADHVAAVHGPSATLAHLTVRRPVASALDVGTGNGIQALLASANAEWVVATTQLIMTVPNPRSVRCSGSARATCSDRISRKAAVAKEERRLRRDHVGRIRDDQVVLFAGHGLEEAASAELDVLDPVDGGVEGGERQRSIVQVYKVKLTDVLVSLYNQGGSTEGDHPMDEFALKYTKIEVNYDGVVRSWDVQENKA